jgi:pilus assembly protein Flp/PilA
LPVNAPLAEGRPTLARNLQEGATVPRLSKLFRSEEGAAAVEYGLLAALIAAVILLGLSSLGGTLQDKLSRLAEQVGAAMGSNPASGPGTGASA